MTERTDGRTQEPIHLRTPAILALVPALLMTAAAAVGCGASSAADASPATGGASGRGGSGAAGRAGSAGRSGAAGGNFGAAGRSAGFAGAVGTAGRVGFGGSSAGGTGGAPAGTGGSSGSGGVAGCVVSIQAISPQPLGNTVEFGPRVKLQMRATVSNTTVSMPHWTWTVTEYRDIDGQTVHPDVKALDEPASNVVFAVASMGSYDIHATVVEDAVRCSGHTTIVGVPPGPPAYVFRATATGLPVQEVRVPITASTVAATLSLDAGQAYAIRPHGLNPSVLLPAYVRITSPVTPSTFEGDTSRGIVTAWLLPKINYDLLLVPADETYAPQLLNALPGAWGLNIDQGIPVTGGAFAPDGTPLEDTRLVLRQDQRPSTVGISGAAGDFQLWARPGNLSAVASPALDSGLAQASVDVTPSNAGFVLPSGASSATVSVRWNAVTQATLSLAVRGLDGTTPVEDARVHVSSNAWVAPVATLVASVSGAVAVTFPALGTVDRDAVADAAGQVMVPKLPVGTYTVTVTPPASVEDAAVTTVSLAVPPAGVTQTLTLARKVPFTGTLAPSPAAAGARVTAFDQSAGPRSAPAVTTASDGGVFTLLVDPGRAFQLVIEPSPGRGLGRTVVSAIAAGSTSTDAGSITLAPGRAIVGSVVTGGLGVADAFIQVFCEPSAASCVDPTQSLAEAITRGDGRFDLVVPDPSPN